MFLSARLKIDRANEHLRDLESSIHALPSLSSVSVQPDPLGRGNTIEHTIPNFTDVMNRFALLTGDSIHNFRTALDHAWADSLRSVGLPVTSYTKFPVRPDVENLKGVLKGIKVHTASPALFDVMVSQIKAYKAGNGFLWDLHYLDIADKHELLLPVVGYGSVNDIRVENQEGETITGSTYGWYWRDVVRIDIPATHKIQYHGDRATSIQLGQGEFAHGLEATGFLQIVARITLNIVMLLEKTVTQQG